MASLDKVVGDLLAIQANSPYDVSDALILIEAQAARIKEADLILDFMIPTYDFDDCGDPSCEECHFERLLARYYKQYHNE